MGTVNLPNLYTVPTDIFDLLGSDGSQLRVDDPLAATGQTVTVTAPNNQGDTSVSVAPLLYPLLPGSTLEFSGANLPAVVEVVLAAVAQTGDTTLTVFALPAALTQYATARDSGVNTVFAMRLAKACKYGTAEVKLWCCPRYQDSDLATAWSANRWATARGCLWLCRRRGNPVPASIKEEAEEALQALKMVQRNQLHIEDIATRNPNWPFISNATVDPRYDIARVRVQPALSEGTPTLYPTWVDWNAALVFGDFWGYF